MAIDRLISADSHITIGHERVKEKLSSKYHGAYDAAVAALTPPGKKPHFEHEAWGRAGEHDPYERLKDMDLDGVDVEVLYTDLGAGTVFYHMKEGAQEGFRAFNDAAQEFAGVDPKRLIVSYPVSVLDIDVAIAEVQRLAADGARSIQLPAFPNDLNLREYYDEHYDRLWAAVQETGIPISLHLAAKKSLAEVALRDPTPQKAVMHSMSPLALSESIGFWLLGGALERFPRLKLAFVEPGLAWVPFLIDLYDEMVTRKKYDFPAIVELPSAYFRRQCFLTFVNEPRGMKLRHDVGIENIMWSTDYPHPATTWPHSRELVAAALKDVPEEEQELIVCGNAARVYGV